MTTATKTRGPKHTQINAVALPSPTVEDMKAGIIYCYGLKPHGQLYRALVIKLKNGKIHEIVENIETMRAMQVGHIARAMDISGFGRP